MVKTFFFPSPLTTFMKPLHRLLGAFQEKNFYGLRTPADRIFKLFSLSSAERFQHIIGRVLAGPFRPPNSHFEPGEAIDPQGFDDGFNAFVASVSSLEADADLSPGQV